MRQKKRWRGGDGGQALLIEHCSQIGKQEKDCTTGGEVRRRPAGVEGWRSGVSPE
jgi:hypothetical protein